MALPDMHCFLHARMAAWCRNGTACIHKPISFASRIQDNYAAHWLVMPSTADAVGVVKELRRSYTPGKAVSRMVMSGLRLHVALLRLSTAHN